MNMINSILIVMFIQATPVLAKEKNVNLAKENMLQKALAENAIFKCSAKKTYSSRSTGKKLDKEILKACVGKVEKLSRWYDKKEKEELSKRLLSNGKRSALANRRFL